MTVETKSQSHENELQAEQVASIQAGVKWEGMELAKVGTTDCEGPCLPT
jgi:hypothetical protein